MKFDVFNTAALPDGVKAEYGVIRGNSSVVIIKAGSGGSCVGDGDRYLKLGKMLHDSAGCTVVCFSNFSNDSFLRADAAVIRELVSQLPEEARLYFIGVSNGATQGLIDAAKEFPFRRMLLVNMPLMINFHKIKDALTRVATDIRFVYGERDPSITYVPFLELVTGRDTCAARAEIVRVPQADHNFAGMTDTFLSLGMGVLQSDYT